MIFVSPNETATVSSGAFFSNCSHPPNVLTAVAAAKAAAAYFIIRFINLPHSISIFSVNDPTCILFIGRLVNFVFHFSMIL